MLEVVDELERNGHNLQHFSRELSRYFRNLLVARIAGPDRRLLAASDAQREQFVGIAAQFSEEDLTRYLALSLELFTDLQSFPSAALPPGARLGAPGARRPAGVDRGSAQRRRLLRRRLRPLPAPPRRQHRRVPPRLAASSPAARPHRPFAVRTRPQPESRSAPCRRCPRNRPAWWRAIPGSACINI